MRRSLNTYLSSFLHDIPRRRCRDVCRHNHRIWAQLLVSFLLIRTSIRRWGDIWFLGVVNFAATILSLGLGFRSRGQRYGWCVNGATDFCCRITHCVRLIIFHAVKFDTIFLHGSDEQQPSIQRRWCVFTSTWFTFCASSKQNKREYFDYVRDGAHSRPTHTFAQAEQEHSRTHPHTLRK